jgi:hypothetical protein
VAFSFDTKAPAAGVAAAAAAAVVAAVLLGLAAGVVAAAAVSGAMTTAPITPPVSIDTEMTPPAISLLDALILISPLLFVDWLHQLFSMAVSIFLSVALWSWPLDRFRDSIISPAPLSQGALRSEFAGNFQELWGSRHNDGGGQGTS